MAWPIWPLLPPHSEEMARQQLNRRAPLTQLVLFPPLGVAVTTYQQQL
jgi:hypothetical protein